MVDFDIHIGKEGSDYRIKNKHTQQEFITPKNYKLEFFFFFLMHNKGSFVKFLINEFYSLITQVLWNCSEPVCWVQAHYVLAQDIFSPNQPRICLEISTNENPLSLRAPWTAVCRNRTPSF